MSEREIIRVREVMKPDYDTVDGMATVKEAVDAMQHREMHCLIVNKRHADDEYGILLMSDIARFVLAKDRNPERVNVYEIMAKPVVSVDPAMDIRYCAQLFSRLRLTRAPVIAEGKVLGIVSFTDLVLRGMQLRAKD